MSANFIVEYAGAPLRFGERYVEMVREEQATPFISEADAALAIYRAHVNMDWCKIVNLHARQRQALRSN